MACAPSSPVAPSGIGRATVRALRTRGAAVASLDLRPLAEPEEDILEIPCDVGNDASVRDAVAKVAEQLGGLDVVVSNAGIGAAGRSGGRHRRGVAPRPGHQPRRHGPPGTRRTAPPAPVTPHRTRSRGCAPVPSPPGPVWSNERRIAPARAPCTRSSSRWQPTWYARAYASTPLPRAPPIPRGSSGCWPPRPTRRRLSKRCAPDSPPAASSPQNRSPHAVCYLASPLAGATTGTILQVDGGSRSTRLAACAVAA